MKWDQDLVESLRDTQGDCFAAQFSGGVNVRISTRLSAATYLNLNGFYQNFTNSNITMDSQAGFAVGFGFQVMINFLETCFVGIGMELNYEPLENHITLHTTEDENVVGSEIPVSFGITLSVGSRRL